VIELINVLVAAVAGFVLGLTVHSAYLHSKKHKNIQLPWNHGENGKE